MIVNKIYHKASLTFICFFILIISCKQKNPNQKVVEIDVPYKFKTEKAENLSVKAFGLRKEKKYEEAITIYEEAIKIEPDNPKLFFDVSVCYSIKKEYAKALSAMDSAIILDSLNSSFYNNRGLVYWKLHQDGNAITDYKKSIMLDSMSWVAYSNLSIVYYWNNMKAEACEKFKIAKTLGLTYDIITTDNHLKVLEESCK